MEKKKMKVRQVIIANHTRPFQLLLGMFFFLTFTSFGQSESKYYRLIFGVDTFKTLTYTKPGPIDTHSTREYSYLFKDNQEIIRIPRRIDTIVGYDMSYGRPKRQIIIDTVDQVVVSKVVDTINKLQIDKIINTEIQIFSNRNKLKLDEVQFETIQPGGKSSYTIDLQRPRIREGSHAFREISSLEKGGYLILKTVWFYDLRNNRREIECNVAWFINE